jgi:hypothetical protein
VGRLGELVDVGASAAVRGRHNDVAVLGKLTGGVEQGLQDVVLGCSFEG